MLNKDDLMIHVKPEHKESYLLYQQGKKLAAYSSHQPVLAHVVNTITTGTVLEYGMGYNSTPMLHILCALQGRDLISIENEKEWYLKFGNYSRSFHTLKLIKTLSDFEIKDEKYAIVFVDGGLDRHIFIDKIKNNADYIVVHDTELYVERKKDDIYKYDFSMFKHVHHFKFKNSYPMTSLLSNLDKIDERLLSIF